MQESKKACVQDERHEPLVLVLEYNRVLESGGSQLFFELTKYYSASLRVELLWKPQWSLATNCLSRLFRSRVLRYLRTRSSPAAAVFAFLTYRVLLPRYEAELGRKYSNVPVLGVWAPSHELLPLLAMALARRFQCPFHISMFDIPYTFALKKVERAVVEQGFLEWMKEAEAVDYASQRMRDHCTQLRVGKGSDDFTVWSSAGVACCSERTPRVRRNITKIVFCGSLRFFREIRSLSQALILLERLYDEKIVLRIYSGKPFRLPKIENMRFIADRAELRVALQECDLAYSPLSLDGADRLLAETSFPGKIATYLQADLPILAHAPAHASNYRFVTENEVGLGIAALDPESIAAKIHEYSESVELRERHVRNCRAALQQYFVPETRADYFSRLFAQSSCRAGV